MSHNDTTSNNPTTTKDSPNNSTSPFIDPFCIKDSIYSYLKLSRCEMALLIYMLFQTETEKNKWIEN